MRSLALVALLFIAAPAWATVTIDWVTVGDPGNAADTLDQAPGNFGSVGYVYRIGKYEVTNSQYSEFLNATAATDTYGLYHENMGVGFGAITRSGSTGSYTYNIVEGQGKLPVKLVSFYDSLRFANWLHNGQPTGGQNASTTEDGAYTITPEGIAANSITRNAEATFFLPSEDEWYKAAYYDALSQSYFDFPAGSDVETTCATPGATPNSANCFWVIGNRTDVGSYTGSASPAGTFDQGGNLWEWTEDINTPTARALRGHRGFKLGIRTMSEYGSYGKPLRGPRLGSAACRGVV